MEPILEVKDLTKKFPQQGKGDFLAVDHISFRLDRGETLGVVGDHPGKAGVPAERTHKRQHPFMGTGHYESKRKTTAKDLSKYPDGISGPCKLV